MARRTLRRQLRGLHPSQTEATTAATFHDGVVKHHDARPARRPVAVTVCVRSTRERCPPHRPDGHCVFELRAKACTRHKKMPRRSRRSTTVHDGVVKHHDARPARRPVAVTVCVWSFAGTLSTSPGPAGQCVFELRAKACTRHKDATTATTPTTVHDDVLKTR
jgi:hypothetical protein